MSVTIGGYEFDGPFKNTNTLEDRSGVYAILDRRSDGKLYIIDIGESANVKTRLDSHDRADSWVKSKKGSLECAVLYTPNKQQSGRMEIEQELRAKYSPPCGKR